MRERRVFRRGALASLGIGVVGFGAAIGTQIGRYHALRVCGRRGDPKSDACVTSDVLEGQLNSTAGIGLAMMIAGGAAAGTFVGNAAASRDVRGRGLDAEPRTFARFVGIITMGLTSAWALERNIRILNDERRCDGDRACVARQRPRRFIINNVATLGVGLGAGFLGYSFAYEKQGRALMKLRAMPNLGLGHAGATVSMSF